MNSSDTKLKVGAGLNRILAVANAKDIKMIPNKHQASTPHSPEVLSFCVVNC
jgi:hypothetical protein